MNGYPWFTPDHNRRFLDLAAAYNTTLTMQVYGHHHTDAMKVMKDAEGSPAGLGLLAPGVTPWRSTLAPETGANNPGVRLVEYDDQTGEVRFLMTFYFYRWLLVSFLGLVVLFWSNFFRSVTTYTI